MHSPPGMTMTMTTPEPQPDAPVDDEGGGTRAMLSLLAFIAAVLPVLVLLFLFISGFFTSWDGQAAKVRPQGGEPPKYFDVLVVEDGGGTMVQTWPAGIVNALGDLPIDPFLVPPSTLDPKLPHTRKARFQLSFLIEASDGTFISLPTTSPGKVGVIALLLMMAIAVRNMVVSGSPIEIERREERAVRPMPSAGQLSAPMPAKAQPMADANAPPREDGTAAPSSAAPKAPPKGKYTWPQRRGGGKKGRR